MRFNVIFESEAVNVFIDRLELLFKVGDLGLCVGVALSSFIFELLNQLSQGFDLVTDFRRRWLGQLEKQILHFWHSVIVPLCHLHFFKSELFVRVCLKIKPGHCILQLRNSVLHLMLVLHVFWFVAVGSIKVFSTKPFILFNLPRKSCYFGYQLCVHQTQ